MNNDKSRIITRVLWIFGAIILVIAICYLIYSCSLLNSDDVSLDDLAGCRYISDDSDYFIYFSTNAQTFNLDMPGAAYNNVTISDYYENMIFFEIGDEEYIIAVIDKTTLFLSNARAYLYIIK